MPARPTTGCARRPACRACCIPCRAARCLPTRSPNTWYGSNGGAGAWVAGRRRADKLYAAALRRSAKKFGAVIATEKDWTFRTANARADTGHVTLQTEIPAFTRVADHDVLVVADEVGEFGDYLEGRTALPRPVAGTSGLVATGWSRVNEQWGATPPH